MTTRFVRLTKDLVIAVQQIRQVNKCYLGLEVWYEQHEYNSSHQSIRTSLGHIEVMPSSNYDRNHRQLLEAMEDKYAPMLTDLTV